MDTMTTCTAIVQEGVNPNGNLTCGKPATEFISPVGRPIQYPCCAEHGQEYRDDLDRTGKAYKVYPA